MEKLVRQLKLNGVLQDKDIARAFLEVDRADFIPEQLQGSAYSDQALPIGEGQTISQPTVVAFMLGLLALKPGDKIMDIGAGSGWQTALLAKIVGEKGRVYAMEIIPELCEQAQKNLAKYNFENIEFFCQNARQGLPELAPFDGIITGASGEEIPKAWKEQLKIGGRIVAPVGDSIFRYIKKSNKKFAVEEYPGFVFVPLVK